MKHHAVTHSHVIVKNKGILVLHHVQDAAVLDIGVFSNADVVNIAANNGVKPHTGVISDLHIANNLRPVGDEDPISKLREFAFVVQQHKSKRTTLTERVSQIQGSEDIPTPLSLSRQSHRTDSFRHRVVGQVHGTRDMGHPNT
jgi:hypothetical protein